MITKKSLMQELKIMVEDEEKYLNTITRMSKEIKSLESQLKVAKKVLKRNATCIDATEKEWEKINYDSKRNV